MPNRVTSRIADLVARIEVEGPLTVGSRRVSAPYETVGMDE